MTSAAGERRILWILNNLQVKLYRPTGTKNVFAANNYNFIQFLLFLLAQLRTFTLKNCFFVSWIARFDVSPEQNIAPRVFTKPT